MNKIKFIAHRGNQVNFVENSIESIMDCINKPYIDGVEFDIRPSLDDEIVIMHNNYVYNDKKEKVIIKDTLLSELKKCHFEYGNKEKLEQILSGLISKDKDYLKRYLELQKLRSNVATFEDVITTFSKSKEMLIEIKCQNQEYSNNKTKIFIDNILRYLEVIQDKTFKIESYNLEVLSKIKEKNEEVSLVSIHNRWCKRSDINEYFDGYSLEYALANPKLIDKIIESNKILYTWDNKMSYFHMKKMMEIYQNYQKEIEDGILSYNVICDYPEKAKSYIYR